MKNRFFFLIMAAIASITTLVFTGSLVSFATVVNEQPKIWPMWICAAILSVAGLAFTTANYRKWRWGTMFVEL